ncbi:MAG: hypothetical protein R6X27_09555 [Candidatus Desulfacyla sp.]
MTLQENSDGHETNQNTEGPVPVNEMTITVLDDMSTRVTGIPEDYQTAMNMLSTAANRVIDYFGKDPMEAAAKTDASGSNSEEHPGNVQSKKVLEANSAGSVPGPGNMESGSEPKVCLSCQTPLRESLINDDYMICPCCEILFRKEIKSINPTDPSLGENYRGRAIDILNADKRHYEAFYSNPLIVEKFRIPLLHKEYILAIGGGHPKLESYLKPKKIEVCDFFPEAYIELLDYFKELYAFDGRLEYRRIKVDGSYSYPDLSSPEDSLITFVHFLEHMNYDVIIKLLEDLPANTDVAIYGPNAEIKPMTKRWFHFSQQHLTLIPLKRFRQIILDMGYIIKYDTPFALDMLILFNTGNND